MWLVTCCDGDDRLRPTADEFLGSTVAHHCFWCGCPPKRARLPVSKQAQDLRDCDLQGVDGLDDETAEDGGEDCSGLGARIQDRAEIHMVPDELSHIWVN